YTNLTGGVPVNPALPADPKCLAGAAMVPGVSAGTLCPAPVYPADFDPGLAAWTPDGRSVGLLQWTTFNLGLQYYFPGPDGRLFISGNFSRSVLRNANKYADPNGMAKSTILANAAKVRDHEDWANVSLFGDPYPGVRFGLDYGRFMDTYMDGVQATNNRVQ